MSDDWPGVVCRPCELNCYGHPPPEKLRPFTCPSCRRLWERAEDDAERDAEEETG